MRLLYTIIALTISCSSKGEETILDWDSLNTEAGIRRAVEDTFPSLRFGFYHWTGTWIIGALEDFERDRFLLLLPTEGIGDAKLIRNGVQQQLPPGEPVTLRTAGALHTAEGIVNLPEEAQDRRIGYWVSLRATDRLMIETTLTYPAKGKFVGTYDPDNGWQTSCEFKIADQNMRDPADAYEIMRGSLLKQVLEVMNIKKECVVRLDSPKCFRLNLPLRQWVDDDEYEIDPLELELTDKIVRINGNDGRTDISLQELQNNLNFYGNVAMSAHVRADVKMRVYEDTDDQLFRSVLTALGSENLIGQVYLIVEPSTQPKE